MQTLKMWPALVLTFSAYLYGCAMSVEIMRCNHPVKDEPCNMTCKVPNLSGAIDINCNGTSRGSCITAGCGPNMYREGGDTVHLQIPSLSYTNDNCRWTCTYGATSSLPLTYIIYSGISIAPNLTSQKDADGVKFTAIADCVYPSNPDVVLQYSEVSNGQFASLNTQPIDLQSSTTPGGCSDSIEKRVTAISDVSATHKDLAGKNMFFRMKFSQYQSGPEIYTYVLGPFYFNDCSQDIFLYGFLPVFLIVLIASIAINILKIDFLSKQFGEFTWKKGGITAVFCVIAVIIGVCLGLLIKGCDKKFLALGLSFLFGILLVVALIIVLIYYHKKCESKSDIQDGDGGEDSNRSSQNNTGSNTTRTGTGRVGSPASTSNVELAANLNRNKTDVPKGDQSALNQKAWQSPLPLPPVASQPPTASTHNLPLSRNNQLGPIAVENEEANSSEKKKKKKKKKKKRIVDEAEDNENES